MNEGTRYILETKLRELTDEIATNEDDLKQERRIARETFATVKRLKAERDDIKADLEEGNF